MRSGIGSLTAGRPAFRENSSRLFRRVPFSAFRLRITLLQAGDYGGATGGEIHPLGFQQVEGLVKEVSRSSIASGGELLLDAGFGGGIEDEAHGRKYNAGAGEGEPVRAASGGVRATRECGAMCPRYPSMLILRQFQTLGNKDNHPMPENVTGDKTAPVAGEPVKNILATLGLLFSPVTAIALFCAVLGVSGQNTATISIITVLLTALCLFRKEVNTRIPSSLVIALLIALAATFTMNYEHILFKDTGLIRYFRTSNDFLGQEGPFLDNAKSEIWFVGMDFHITAGDRKDMILKKLNQGVKVRFLVFDPSSPMLDTIGRDFDQTPQAIESECTDSLSSLVSLQDEWMRQDGYSHYPDGLEIRLFQDAPHARYYLTDPDDPRAKSYFVPYMNHENSPSLPGFLLGNINNGVIQAYVPGIRKLWTSSEPLDTYLSEHSIRPGKAN